MEFCKAQFELGKRQADGSTLRETLESIERVTGKTHPLLQSKNLPTNITHIWNWFIQLHNSRTSSGFGVNPISYQELWCFFQLEKIEPEPWEIDLIKKFDSIALESFANAAEQEQSKAKAKQPKK